MNPVFSNSEPELGAIAAPSPHEPALPYPHSPHLVLQAPDPDHTIYAFAPNRNTLGGTAYLIVEEATILVDCPPWNATTQDFLAAQGGVRWLFLTHRGGMGEVRSFQQAFGCEVVVQEQEAYLLPNLTVTRFEQTIALTAQTHALWTPGHSPGSACLYHSGFGGVLFSGRHLLPTPQAELRPLKTSKTFHWRRQLQSVKRLRDEFCADTLTWICPGANTGFLRGQRTIDQAYDRLIQIELA